MCIRDRNIIVFKLTKYPRRAIRPQPRKKYPQGLSSSPPLVVVRMVVVVVTRLVVVVDGGFWVVVGPAVRQAHTLQTVVSTNLATGHCGTGWMQPSAG